MATNENATPQRADFASKYEGVKESLWLNLGLEDAWLFKALCDTWKASQNEAFRRAVRMAVADAGIDVPPLELGSRFARERVAVRVKGSKKVLSDRDPGEIIAAAIVDADGEVLWDRTYGPGRPFSDDAAEFGKVFRSACEVCVWGGHTLALLEPEGVEPVLGQWVFDDSHDCARLADYAPYGDLGSAAFEMSVDMDKTGAQGLVRDCLGILGIRDRFLRSGKPAPSGRLKFL